MAEAKKVVVTLPGMARTKDIAKRYELELEELDPVGIELEDEEMERIEYDLEDDELVVDDDDCYVEVGGNIEMVICAVLDTVTALFQLNVSHVPETARGGVILIGPNMESSRSLTDDLRSGVTSFTIAF